MSDTLSIVSSDVLAWRDDWLWALPLIVLTIVIHVFGLGLVSGVVSGLVNPAVERRQAASAFAGIMGLVALMVTVLHAVAGVAWAVTYYLLGALPNATGAVLYSFGAITTYGHAELFLRPQWQLMGTLEALNGLILFGLTTAFMFAMIERVWPEGIRRSRA
jgi:hypothetical protein